MTFPQQTPNQFPNQNEGLRRFGSQPIDLNIYNKKDPAQDYNGWGYALNNLMRHPNLLGGMRFPQESFAPQEGQSNPFGGALSVGLPFMADLIYGNKYRNTGS